MGSFAAVRAARWFGGATRVAGQLAAAVLTGLVLMAAPGAAQAACQNSLDFTGAAVNSTRTLDVSTCNDDIRWGLYKLFGTNSNDYFPVSGNAFYTTAPDSADITLANGAVLRFSPAATETITNSAGAQTILVNSYTVTLLTIGGSSSTTATLYYNSGIIAFFNANSFVSTDQAATDTAYPITVTNLPANGPEIAVSGSIGGAVDDGQTSAQGNRTVGTPVTVTYTVTNNGNANLTLATATGASPSGVTVGNITAPGSTTVAGGGGTTTFQVTYTPNAAGAFSFNLSFTNNDSDENPFNFTVSGTGVPPAPVLTVSATPSAAEQTVGRTYSFTVTPGAAAGGRGDVGPIDADHYLAREPVLHRQLGRGLELQHDVE